MQGVVIPIVCLVVAAHVAGAQRPVTVAPNAPPDRPVSAVERCQWDATVRAMEPYVARARETYPAAKARFLAGLPARHSFFVTVRLTDKNQRNEQVFLAVDSIANGKIGGRIWSQIGLVSGYRLGQAYTIEESEIVDWLVSRPDGTEEGNVVGVFLDTYTSPPCRGTE